MTKNAQKMFAAAIVGLSLGIATLDMEKLSSISANPILGVFQEGLIFALVPGLIPSVAVGSLWIGCVVNATFYFALIWSISSLLQRHRRKQRKASPIQEDHLG
jgi:uncharacterized protein (DUF2062 family)